MKKLFIITLTIFLNSCVVHGPYTGTKYELGVDAEKGLFMSAKPMSFNEVSKAVEKTYDWLTED